MHNDHVQNIKKSKITIYDPISIGDPTFWIPTEDLEEILRSYLQGLSLKGLALRTRSKVIKTKVCEAMGYPVPSSFKKVQPRFSGQNLDIYTQKSSNLQIWNEEISPSRRYAIIAIGQDDTVKTVKVVNGDALAKLDTTGTLTQKYQARLSSDKDEGSWLLTDSDTSTIKDVVAHYSEQDLIDPSMDPDEKSLMPIELLFEKLKKLTGIEFSDIGSDQERNRAAILHEYASKSLGYELYRDNGQFPDIRHQLLEVKLQTSRTIDLGLVSPDSDELLDTQKVKGFNFRHSDVRYALFGANIEGGLVKVTHLYLTTGQDFYNHFTQFQGNVVNKKLQIPLPGNFFS